MKHSNIFAFRPVFRLLSGAACLVLLVIGLAGCGSPSGDKSKEGDTTDIQQTTDLSISCYRIDSSVVKTWIDSGWLKPGAGNNRIMLQFSTEAASGINSNMGLLCYLGSSNSDVKGTGTRLTADTTCVPLKVSGPVNFTNNFIKLSDLKLTNPGGDLISFDYILLRPSVTNYPPYLNFNVSVVRNAAAPEEMTGSKGSWPCPVYCF